MFVCPDTFPFFFSFLWCCNYVISMITRFTNYLLIIRIWVVDESIRILFGFPKFLRIFRDSFLLSCGNFFFCCQYIIQIIFKLYPNYFLIMNFLSCRTFSKWLSCDLSPWLFVWGFCWFPILCGKNYKKTVCRMTITLNQ